MRIRSFKALRPSLEAVNDVVSLPYDVVSTEEARQLADSNPSSMLRVVRAEIDFPEVTDPYSDPVYAKAVENLERLQAEGKLVREEIPCMYLYQQQMEDHIQQGIVALSHVDDYENGLIKKHENTRVDKENDRTRLTSDLSANPGPVFLAYQDIPAVSTLMKETAMQAPLYNLVSDDGIRHTVWRIVDTGPIEAAFAALPCTYVADGHHRAASAARVGQERKIANPDHTGEEDYNWFLTVLFPGRQLKILPYNRLVHDLNGLSKVEFLEKLEGIATVQESSTDTPETPGQICFYLHGKWYRIHLETDINSDPVSRLDVSMLQDRILAPVLGISDQRTSKRIDFIGGIRGTAYLKDQVDAGAGEIAFSMYPVSVSELMDIADANQIMAPKSTWFEPKLRSGFFIHTF